jgi:hypothetical protein
MKVRIRNNNAGTREDGEKVIYSLKQIRNLNRWNKRLLSIRWHLEVAKSLKESSAS